MAVEPSALSVAARDMRAYLADRLALTLDQVVISHPALTAREQEANSSNARDMFNIFFFRVEYDGYPADGTSDNPHYVRAFCLLTSFSTADPGINGLSPGEKDLRYIGSALHAFHRQPFILVRDQDGNEAARLQVVPSSLTVDDINHIWATQGELPYRLSIAYELALLPMPLARPVDPSPRVGGIGLGVGRDEPLFPGFRVPPVTIDGDAPDWVPALRFIDNAGALHQTLAFASGAVPAAIALIGTGAAATAVQLVWEAWDSSHGWRVIDDTASLTLHMGPLDPALPLPGSPVAVALPATNAGQLQLTARRVWHRPDGADVTLRSGPLLITIYPEAGG